MWLVQSMRLCRKANGFYLTIAPFITLYRRLARCHHYVLKSNAAVSQFCVAAAELLRCFFSVDEHEIVLLCVS